MDQEVNLVLNVTSLAREKKFSGADPIINIIPTAMVDRGFLTTG